jgi:hypothetical protein
MDRNSLFTSYCREGKTKRSEQLESFAAVDVYDAMSNEQFNEHQEKLRVEAAKFVDDNGFGHTHTLTHTHIHHLFIIYSSSFYPLFIPCSSLFILYSSSIHPLFIPSLVLLFLERSPATRKKRRRDGSESD